MVKHRTALSSVLLGFAFLLAGDIQAAVPAVEGTGKVVEIVDCGTGNTAWRGVTLFKLDDGQWFGLWTTHASDGANPQLSLVLLAYSKSHVLTVRASNGTQTWCGITSTMFWNDAGDYIRLSQ